VSAVATAIRDRLLDCAELGEPGATDGERAAWRPTARADGVETRGKTQSEASRKPKADNKARALQAAKEAAPHLAALAGFLLSTAPSRPLSSQTIRAVGVSYHESASLALQEALDCPWLALDSATMRNVLAVDVDHSDGPQRAEDLATRYGLPRPTLVMCPWSGRAHAIWKLESPVATTERARRKPQALADLAVRLLAAAMNATPLPKRSLLKSPWGLTENLIGRRLQRTPAPTDQARWDAYIMDGAWLMWLTVPGDLRPVKLLEVVAALDGDHNDAAAIPQASQKQYRKHRRELEPDAPGRNCELFDRVRYRAYRHGETDLAAILEEAERVNANFATPLPACDVRATARSVHKFMVTRYRRGTGRGRDTDATRTTGMTQTERNAFTGKLAAAARIVATDAKIADALNKLQAEGKSITQAAVAKAAHLSIRTVQRHWLRAEVVRAVTYNHQTVTQPPAHQGNSNSSQVVPGGANGTLVDPPSSLDDVDKPGLHAWAAVTRHQTSKRDGNARQMHPSGNATSDAFLE
jgi:Replicase family/Primase C terminal 1 (PriCT-1)